MVDKVIKFEKSIFKCGKYSKNIQYISLKPGKEEIKKKLIPNYLEYTPFLCTQTFPA